ncbi:MAG TPA: hypothetical protein PLT67_03935 [Kiritimatiellia bacterium]|jgi:hypothetical protein|nr:hypothetical protein [Kiritimatiellia bacterium]HQQ03970.1 hypothetical protein [Kiritimatiellia bacterium]
MKKAAYLLAAVSAIALIAGCARRAPEQELSPEEKAFAELSQKNHEVFSTTNEFPLRANAEELLRMNRYKPDGYFWRGVAATGEGNFIDAEKDLEIAVMLEPAFPMAREYLQWVREMKTLVNPGGPPAP